MLTHLAACGTVPTIREGFTNDRAGEWRASLPRFGDAITASGLYQDYVRHYGLPVAQGHAIGYVDVDGYRIAVQRFGPEKAGKTVVFAHGYLVHSALHGDFIERLLDKGFTVYAYDLPGHGLSAGRRGDIYSFQDYAGILEYVASKLPPESANVTVVAHSTSAAATIEALRNRRALADHIILGAPLVRPRFWWFALMGDYFTGWAKPIFGRMYRKSTSNQDYLDFTRYRDPLLVRTSPMTWVRALIAWEASLADYPLLSNPILILQGTRDRVVQTQHNIEFLEDHFTKAQVIRIPGARHELFVEPDHLLSQIVEAIQDYTTPQRNP